MSETATSEPVTEMPPAATKQKPTEYHVLKLEPGSTGANEKWSVHARNVEAQGAQAAVRKVATVASNEDSSQTFVAVPSRSFKPVTVAVETKTQLVLS